ncbi:hypothetical protein HDV05_005973, partial [Chytridiales sp. JEL 0842]
RKILLRASECLINIAIRRGWKDQLSNVQPLVQNLFACYFAIEDAVEPATDRLRRSMPYLFEDCTDQLAPGSDIYYPTRLLLSVSCYEKLEQLLSLGYKMDWARVDLTNEQYLWLYRNRLCNFRQLFRKLAIYRLINLCADCPILARKLKRHAPNLLETIGEWMDEMTLKGLKMLVEMQFDGYDTFPWLDHVGWQNDLEVLKYFHQQFPNSATTEAMDTAANIGNLDAVRFLHENRTEGCTTRAMDDAACNDNLDVIKFLHFNRTEGCTTDAMDDAASNGNLEIVKFLHKNRTEGCTYRAIVGAMENCHLDVVMFLLLNRTFPDAGEVEIDLRPRHHKMLSTPDIVPLLLHHFPQLASSVLSVPISCGDVEMIRSVVEEFKELDLSIPSDHQFIQQILDNPLSVTSAFAIGQLSSSILKDQNFGKAWIIASSVELDWSLLEVKEAMARELKQHSPNLMELLAGRMMAAMTFKGFKMVVEMQFDGYDTFPWIDNVIMHEDLEFLKYCHQQFPNSATTEAMDTAANIGNLEAVRFLHENRNEGCTTKAMDDSACNKFFDIVKFLHFNRTEGCTTGAMDCAAGHGYLDIVTFLHKNRTEGCTYRAIVGALEDCHLDVVMFLLRNRTFPDAGEVEIDLRPRHHKMLSTPDLVPLLLHHFPQLASSVLSVPISCGDVEMVRSMFEDLKELDLSIPSDHQFIQQILDNPLSVTSAFAIGQLSSSILKDQNFGKAWIITSSVELDWSLLEANDTMVLLNVILLYSGKLEDMAALKQCIRWLIELLMGNARLDYKSPIFKQCFDMLSKCSE